MEKTRVPKGEKYWYIGIHNGMISVFVTIDYHSLYVRDIDIQNDFNFKYGNYFYTQEEAESMAKKLRAVLKGADVIEMPSEGKIYKRERAIVNSLCSNPLVSYKAVIVAYNKAIEFLKSKIVK